LRRRELLGVDAAAMQDERKEMPDAASTVGDEVWRARIVTALFGVAFVGMTRISPAPVLRSLPSLCPQGGKHNIG